MKYNINILAEIGDKVLLPWEACLLTLFLLGVFWGLITIFKCRYIFILYLLSIGFLTYITQQDQDLEGWWWHELGYNYPVYLYVCLWTPGVIFLTVYYIKKPNNKQDV